MAKTQQLNIFQTSRMQMNESLQLTFDSLNTYGPLYDDWCLAWSGGKDSSTLVTVVVYGIISGKIKAPKTLTIFGNYILIYPTDYPLNTCYYGKIS